MILQSLYNLYLRKEKELPPEGFEQKEIPFLIILNNGGNFIRLEDTRTPKGKKLIARSFRVPKEHESRTGSTAWKKANILWDHYGYVLGWPKSDSDADKAMAEKQHGTFVSNVKALSDAYPNDNGIKAVYRFLISGQITMVFQDPLWPECKKIPGCNFSFRLDDELILTCENDTVRAHVAQSIGEEQDDENDGEVSFSDVEGFCLVTGERTTIARLHPRTPIFGTKSNAKIVSFQRNMGFDSYGKQQSYNAPTGKRAAFAYTTALNHLLSKESHQKMQVGDATTVFWAEKAHDIENQFYDFFGFQPVGESQQDYAAIKALYEAPKTGADPLLDDRTRFYVLGLAPNAARVAIRYWYQGSVGEVAANIKQHYDDMDIVHAEYEMQHCALNEILAATAAETKDAKKTNRVYWRGKYYDVMPNLAGDVMKAILMATPYPQTLLSGVILRIRAEQSRKDSNGKSIKNVTYPRAALIKSILTRQARYYKTVEKEVGMSLDTSNTNPGYVLGRLFAVLERIQAESSGGWGKINATIRDRFYGAASSTPVAVFPHLMKLKNHHLAKLENYKGFYEGLIGEIVLKLDADNAFPNHLNLQDQGRFAVGYYHQRTKKSDDNSKEA